MYVDDEDYLTVLECSKSFMGRSMVQCKLCEKAFTYNRRFKSPILMITGQKARLWHILPFGSLVYFAVDEQQISDPKFDPRAQAAVYLGQGVFEGRKCVKGYSFNYSNKGHKGRIIFSTNVWTAPTFSPIRKRGEERVTFLSGGVFSPV